MKNAIKAAVSALAVLAASRLAAPPACGAQTVFDLNRPSVPPHYTLAMPAAPLPALPPAATDITAEYSRLFSSADQLSARDIGELRGLRVLFVSGFMTEPLLPGGEKGRISVPRYFEEHLALLRSLGVDCAVASIESEASVADNAARLASQINASPKRVLLISHSKGGIDVLEALLAYPETRPRVRAVIALMSPFFGTPIADKVLAGPLSYSAAQLLRMMGGDKQSLTDLTVARRAAYHARNSAAIEALTREVPFLCIAASKRDAAWSYDTLLEPFRDYMLGLALANDGLVPAASAVLPGGRYVLLDGMDHLASVIKVKAPVFDRPRFLGTVLKLSLTR